MITNIVTFFASLVFMIGGMLTLMISYYKETDCHYKIKNTFPYELNYLKPNTTNLIGKILVALSFLSVAFFYVVYPGNRNNLGPIDVMTSFISVFGVLDIVAMLATSVVDMRNVKVHLICDTFLFSFGFILSVAIAIMGFWTLRAPHVNQTIDIKKIACSSVAIIESLLLAIVLVNPKLRNWSKLEEKSKEDGTKIYLRPKWFVLAWSEWAFIGSTYLNALLLFIMFI